VQDRSLVRGKVVALAWIPRVVEHGRRVSQRYGVATDPEDGHGREGKARGRVEKGRVER
jgi:hypothetical protein